MSSDPTNVQRRSILQISAGLAAVGGAALNTANASVVPLVATGKPGDFDFLTGEWKIKNRQLMDSGWDTFDGEATVHGILAGVGSVEELRIPIRNFSGMGLRLLDVESKLWADYWVNSKSGVLTPPPSWGSFVAGVGTWESDDREGEDLVLYRGVWDQITPSSCRWHQASSRDRGKTWHERWTMNWSRR